MAFEIGQTVQFAGVESVVRAIDLREGQRGYRVDTGEARLPMWIPEDVLLAHQRAEEERLFHQRTPHVIAVDDFFKDPDEIRSIALAQEYRSDERYYKGLRSNMRFLWPFLREEFSRLLGTPVTEWLGYDANGCFQITDVTDPLVWHSDNQHYAAAVYLTPDAAPTNGTSFWRDRLYGCRRVPSNELERARLRDDKAVEAARSVHNDQFNILHGDNWELIESIAGLYNRLVIWDASLVHSATSYVLGNGDPTAKRLVQLFFFDVAT